VLGHPETVALAEGDAVENRSGAESFGSLALVLNSVIRLAERQREIVRRDQLRAAGLTPDKLRAMLDAGRWKAFGPVVVAMHNGPLDRPQQMWAAVLGSGKAACLASLTVLEVRGLRNWADPRVHVLTSRARGIACLPRVSRVIHETRRPPRERWRIKGLPPLAPTERAAIDAASWQKKTRSCCALLAAVVQQRLTTAADLRAALQAAGPIRHRRAMRLTIADIEGGADALSEIDFGQICREHNLGTVVRQVVRFDGKGRRRYIDGEVVGTTGKRRAFEIDGAPHMAALNHWKDLERHNELLIVGTHPLRFSTYAMRFEKPLVVDQTRRALEP
jgi:hypothetical protein